MAHPSYTRNWLRRRIDPAYMAKFYQGNADNTELPEETRQYHAQRAAAWQKIADEEAAK